MPGRFNSIAFIFLAISLCAVCVASSQQEARKKADASKEGRWVEETLKGLEVDSTGKAGH